MSLHLIFSKAGYAAALARRQSGDELVLLGDAVYLSVTGDARPDAHVLSDDMAIRGLRPQPGVKLIDYLGIAELSAQQTPIVSWND